MSKVELSIREACTVCLINGTLPIGDFRLFTEWLDCYQYVIPNDRKLCDYIVDHCTPHTITAPTDIFKLWLLCDWLFSHVYEYEQLRVLKWIQDYNF